MLNWIWRDLCYVIWYMEQQMPRLRQRQYIAAAYGRGVVGFSLGEAANPSYSVTHCRVCLSVCPSVLLFLSVPVLLSGNQVMLEECRQQSGRT